MKYFLLKFLSFFFFVAQISSLNGVWQWQCIDGYCEKTSLTPETEETALSLRECQLYCSENGAIWPKPTGEVRIGQSTAKLNINSITDSGLNSETASGSLGKAAIQRFQQQISYPVPNFAKRVDGGQTLEINFVLADDSVSDITLTTDEEYTLTISQTSDGRLNATIVANNIFGGRHGLESLSQLIIYDNLREEIRIANDVSIADKPAYRWRGILLDTSRNYITVDAIKRTLDAMGASKLNRFHWHITDSHSFPFVSDSLPQLTTYGAYSPQQIYSPQEVKDIVTYGLERGVRVIPEFDAPAHVGEGWNQTTDFITCFNWKPWQDYCVEPPCGQFDPTKDGLYDALESLYGDMLQQFQQPDIFHMGGDEVHFGCWNNTPNIVEWMEQQGWGRSSDDFVKLWDHFQRSALNRLTNKAGRDIRAILWTSTLTEKEHLQYLPKDRYIVQIWTTVNDPQVANLLENGYDVIISNYDALYLDCGFQGWVSDGHNWCSPYKGWQTVYENSPAKIAGDKINQVIGSEAALWAEQVDSSNVDSRLWPRSASLGEVLWSEPTEGWRNAESRFLIHRERLLQWVAADALEPQWCHQREESCPLNGRNNGDWSEPTPEEVTGGSDNAVPSIIVILLLSNVVNLFSL